MSAPACIFPLPAPCWTTFFRVLVYHRARVYWADLVATRRAGAPVVSKRRVRR